MFDQLPNQPPKVEDMFGETPSRPEPTAPLSRAAMPPRPLAPAQTRINPVAPRPTAAPANAEEVLSAAGLNAEDIFGGRRLGGKKIVLLLVVVLAVLGALVGVYALIKSLQSDVGAVNTNAANTNAAVVAPVNTNASTNINAANTNAADTNTAVVTPPKDSDNDGLTDEEEKAYSTDAYKYDTDGDGLTDRTEVKIFKTNPLVADTDGDGYHDGIEVINGYDPTQPGAARLFQTPTD